jgi:hypothetical protein
MFRAVFISELIGALFHREIDETFAGLPLDERIWIDLFRLSTSPLILPGTGLAPSSPLRFPVGEGPHHSVSIQKPGSWLVGAFPMFLSKPDRCPAVAPKACPDPCQGNE